MSVKAIKAKTLVYLPYRGSLFLFLFLNGVDAGAAGVTIYVRNNQNKTNKQTKKKVLVYAVESSQSVVLKYLRGIPR